jgi:hypothetical protein
MLKAREQNSGWNHLVSLAPLIAACAVVAIYVSCYGYFLRCPSPDSGCNPLSTMSLLSGIANNSAMRVTSYIGQAMWTLCNGVHTLTCIAAVIISGIIIYHLLSDYPTIVRWLVILLIIAMAADASLLFSLWTANDTGAPVPQLLRLTVVRVMPDINNFNRLFDALAMTAAFTLACAACATLWKRDMSGLHDEQEIRQRIRLLRYILYVGAVMLIIGVFRLSVMLNWGASFFTPESVGAKTVVGLNSSIVTILGTYYTLLLTAIYLPPAVLLRYRARQLATAQPPEEQESWLEKRGLTLSFTDYLPRVMAILGPLMVGPIGELLVRAFKSSGS